MEHHKLFNEKSALYAKVRPQYPQELFKFLVSLCDERKRAWDVACGNGQAAVDLAMYFAEVHATDVSEQQIAHAIPNPRVRYSVQPAEKTNFAENQFDLVGVAQALHWFDHDLFWDEVKRVLNPDGIFAAWGYSWFSIESKIDQAIKENFLDVIEPYWATQNTLLWNGYRDVLFPFERIDIPKIEMKMEWDLDQLFEYLQSWSAARRCIEEQGEGFILHAYDKVKSAWGDTDQKKTVLMEFTLLVGRNKA
ncbi:MAG: class I SAM-dependent methyltransferase [Anaerolineae bacterium]|jgi:SAM-dependent methyltransferase|nr:class I SAM-dependent methyltransferase [Anaerolineae bacterium]MBT7601183.1 class I SAM-dependent methyltransferase [Anaerolineae bacterium]MBT7991345.1 class I SAM-dependent methyltransferase [Anaerolineae bacterium]